MADPAFDKLAILGVGLIGGSVGLAVRERGLARTVVAYSRTPATRRRAVERGAADLAADSPAACVDGADLVYLASPVATILPLLAELAPHLRPDAVVTDAGSSKRLIVDGAARLDLGTAAFVGGHPMAGSEEMGIDAARGDLFEGMTYVLTPTAETQPPALARLRGLAAAVGSQVLELDPGEHDESVAAISHLPHVLAAALMMVTEERARAGEPVYELTAGSWASGTRVAASGSRLWREILVSNRAAVLRSLDDCAAALATVRGLLAAHLDDDLEGLLEQIRRRKTEHPGR